jgi:signal transduction histidine kinase
MGLYKNQMQWAQENKRKVDEIRRMQQQAIKQEFQTNKVIQTMYNVVSNLIPKSLPMQMLKIKIHI